MRLLLIWPNELDTGCKPPGISMLSAVLKSAGHDMVLFDTSFFDMGHRTNTDVGEETLEFKKIPPGEIRIKRDTVSREGVIKRLLDLVASYRPHLVGVSALTAMYPFGLELLRNVKKHYTIPTIVGGVHATVAPEEVIAGEAVDMLCVGEGEEAVVELANKMDSGSEDVLKVANIWAKKDGIVLRNPVRPLIQDLDSLPFPDWSVYDERQFYKPFLGKVYRYGDFETSRGCVYKCSYCVNDYMQRLYAGQGKYHREKSVKRAIDEIVALKEQYRLEFLKFWDETFLLMSRSRLAEFAREYKARVGLPFVIETTAQSITPKSARLLKEMGCASVSIGLETGSEKLRREVLNKPTSDNAYMRAFRLLNREGIRTVSFNMLGLPYETKEDIFATIAFNKKARVNTPGVGFFYPFKGTRLRDLCIQEGYIPTDDDQVVTTRDGSILKMPQIDPREQRRLRELFLLYTELPRWTYPLLHLCGRDAPVSRRLTRLLKRLVYYKRFGFN